MRGGARRGEVVGRRPKLTSCTVAQLFVIKDSMAVRHIKHVSSLRMPAVEPIRDDFQYSESLQKKSFAEKVLPLMMVLMLVMAFALGALWSKVKYLEKGISPLGAAAQPAAAQQQAAAPEVSQDTIKGLFDKDVIRFGDKNKKLLLVEVADPSCPYCHAAAGKNPELNKQMGAQFTLVADGGTYVAPVVEIKKLVDSGKAAFVYLYTNGHGNGEMAQKAEYCAFESGKFWEVHDRLMTNEGYNLINNEVKNDKANAQKLADFLRGQMNPTDLKNCLESGKYDGRIASDQQLAGSLGVNGTPGFFVNTTRFAGAYSWTDMKSAAEAAL